MELKSTTTSEKPSFVDEFACVSSQHTESGSRLASVSDTEPAHNLCANTSASANAEDEFAYENGSSDSHCARPLSEKAVFTADPEEHGMSDAEDPASTSSSEEECINSIMDYLFVEEPVHAAPCTEPDAFMC